MITDPQVKKFADEQVRPLADKVARMTVAIQAFVQTFEAKALGNLIPNDATVIDDGASTDGRTPITGADVHQMLELATDLVAMASGENTKMPTVLKVAVNPQG